MLQDDWSYHKKSSVNLPRNALLRVYNSFIRITLHYGDITYGKPNSDSFIDKIENIKYKNCIAITGAIQGTPREHLYHELGGLEIFRRSTIVSQTFFYKIVYRPALKYLTNSLNTNDNSVYKTRASERSNIKRFGTRTEYFKQSFFFPFCFDEWYKLDISLRKAENIKCFKSMIRGFFNLKEIIICYTWSSRCYFIVKVTVKV